MTLMGEFTGKKAKEFFAIAKQYVDVNVYREGVYYEGPDKIGVYEVEAVGGELEVTEMRECIIMTGPYQLRVDKEAGVVYIEDVRTYDQIALMRDVVDVCTCGYRDGKLRAVLKVRE